MKSLRALIFYTIILALSPRNLGWRPYKFQRMNVTSTSLSEKIAINASMTKDNGLTAYVEIIKTIQRPFARVEFYVDSGNELFDLKYINQTIDLCRFFNDKKYLPLAQMIYRFGREQGNYPTSCPIKKNIYGIKNYKENVEQLPPVLPEKQFYFGFVFYSMERSVLKPLAVFKTYFKIVNTFTANS